jgi:hypothetical protein
MNKVYKTAQFINKIEENLVKMEEVVNIIPDRDIKMIFETGMEINRELLAELKEYDFINETYLANVFEVLENTIETIICVKIKYLNHKY